MSRISVLIIATAVFLVSTGVFADAPLASIVPKVAFDFWNNSLVQPYNNCYNYGTNRKTNNYAQPGQASGHMARSIACPEILQAAATDLGMEQTAFFPFHGKDDDLLIAVVVWPGTDYHWYRRGDDNMWTHKMGGTPASNLDNSGKVITSPETANRGSYINFCGYFRVKNYNVSLDEQNGGYVRIGNMPDLPPLPSVLVPALRISEPSSVQALVFSGRPDPAMPLRAAMKHLTLPGLVTFAQQLKMGQAAGNMLMTLPPGLSRLGYRGIAINDREGLFFPAGTLAQIRGDDIFVSGRGIHWARIPGLAQVEKQLVMEIRQGHP